MSDPRERIKQLLALARSSQHPHEARNARKKAGELMARHGLNRKEVYQPTRQVNRPTVPTYTGVDYLAATLKEIQRLEAMDKARKRQALKTVLYFVIPYLLFVIGIIILKSYRII